MFEGVNVVKTVYFADTVKNANIYLLSLEVILHS